MPCDCHRTVCEEHAVDFRPFEEPCVGLIRGHCAICDREIGAHIHAYAHLPIELFERAKKRYAEQTMRDAEGKQT